MFHTFCPSEWTPRRLMESPAGMIRKLGGQSPNHLILTKSFLRKHLARLALKILGSKNICMYIPVVPARGGAEVALKRYIYIYIYI